VSRTTPWAPGLFEGRAVLVTGAATGIGRAISEAFHALGASVVMADIDAAEGEAAASQLGDRASFHRVDVADDQDVRRLGDALRKEHGRLDVAVNNAGIELAGRQIHQTERRDWNRVIDVNLTGVWSCLAMEAPLMLPEGGSIINMASALGLVALPDQASYVASKHGVVGLTKAAALEYSSQGIRVNAVCPGVVKTAMVEAVAATDPDFMSLMHRMHPIGRLADTEEVADAVVWLASSGLSFVTGAAISVDGGYISG